MSDNENDPPVTDNAEKQQPKQEDPNKSFSMEIPAEKEYKLEVPQQGMKEQYDNESQMQQHFGHRIKAAECVEAADERAKRELEERAKTMEKQLAEIKKKKEEALQALVAEKLAQKMASQECFVRSQPPQQPLEQYYKPPTEQEASESPEVVQSQPAIITQPTITQASSQSDYTYYSNTRVLLPDLPEEDEYIKIPTVSYDAPPYVAKPSIEEKNSKNPLFTHYSGFKIKFVLVIIVALLGIFVALLLIWLSSQYITNKK